MKQHLPPGITIEIGDDAAPAGSPADPSSKEAASPAKKPWWKLW